MESKDLNASVNRTKVMTGGESCKQVPNTGRWPCDVCGIETRYSD